MEELEKIKKLIAGIENAINYYQENCEKEQSKAQFHEMGCKLQELLFHEAELRLWEAMYLKD